MLHTQRPVNFVEQPEPIGPDGIPARVLTERERDGRKWPIRYDSFELLAILADVATITCTSILCGLSYHLQDGGRQAISASRFGAAILVSALFIPLMKIRGMYRPTELLDLRNQVRAICVAWPSVFLLLAATVFALKIGSEISRGSSMLFAGVGLVALIAHRSFLKELVAKGLAGRRFSGRSIVLITEPSRTGTGLFHTLTGLGFCVQEHFIIPPSGTDSGVTQRLMAKVIEQVRRV